MKKGWQTLRLGDVLEKTETVNPLQSPDVVFDYVDVSSVSNKTFQIEETQRLKGKDAPSRARKLIRANDIIFATIRPTLQRVAIVPKHLDKQVCSTGYFVLRPRAGIDHRFIFYSLLTEAFGRQMESLQKGASYPAVTDGDVRAQEIPVPPLPEQRRIVGLLDEAFAGIATAKANAEKNLLNARELFESYVESVFVEQGDGWYETTVGDQVDFVAGFAFKSSQYTDDNNGVRLLRGDNIAQGKIRWDGVKHWPRKHADDYAQFSLKEHDIVIAMDRPWVSAGLKIASISKQDLPCLQVQRTARLRVSSTMHWRYLFHLLRSSQYVTHLLEGQTGSGVPHISGKQILAFKFSLPPIKVQRTIVQKVDMMLEETQRIATMYSGKVAALDELKKSLLHQAFSGQL
jgi:type I restriction enzyme S subunit